MRSSLKSRAIITSSDGKGKAGRIVTLKENLAMTKRGFQYLSYLNKAYVTAKMVNAVITAVTPYVPIYFSALIIDELAGKKDSGRLILYALLTVGLTFLLFLAGNLADKISNYQVNLLYMRESKVFTDKMMSLDYEKIEDSEINRLRERIRIESQTGYNIFYLTVVLEAFVKDFTKIVSSAAITAFLFLNPEIRLSYKIAMVAGVLLYTFVGYYSGVKEQEIVTKMFSDCVDLNAFGNYLVEHFDNYRAGMEVRMYAMENLAAGLLKDFSLQANKMIYDARRKTLKYSIGSNFFLYFLQFVVYAFVILGALSGNVSVGSVTKYVSCVVLLVGGFQDMVEKFYLCKKNNEYLETYFSFMDIPSGMYQGSLPVEKRILCDNGDNEYEIEFKNVSFRYPSSESYALKDVSLKFRVGEHLAIVGMNGSGKTTFIKLLCRLYDPTEGEILLNGINIRKYDYGEYMSVFAVVFQDFKLFAFSLGQNVAGTVNYDRDRVKDCLEEAGFKERLEEMQQGLDTCLYKDFDLGGIEISGGEAQKIALARALYKKAPFIILDEPTAALDPVAEFEVYSRFNRLVGNRTAIYISHRLSSCRFCDEIIVFHEGRLVQRGSHEALVTDTDGKYHELWNAQAGYYISA